MNLPFYVYSSTLPVLISTCCIEFNNYKTRITVLHYSTTHSNLIISFCIIFDIFATWWTNSTMYIPEYSQYWFQNAVLNLITTRREFNLLQYSTTLSSLITSFCIIFDICYMINLPFYIYSRILPVLISTCCIEFNQYKREFTVLQYSTALSSIIISFCVIFDICYMMNLPFYVYSSTLPVLISTCCIEFNHYKTRITVLQYSTTLSNLITSFCIIFDICYMMNQQYIYMPEYSQYWYQHAAMNLVTTRREFTLLEYSTTLSSLITSFCIIFYICYMMNLPFYIYSSILPGLISTCCIEFNNYKTRITVLQYSTILSNLIASFCIIFDNCYMMNQQYIYILVHSKYWYQHAV